MRWENPPPADIPAQCAPRRWAIPPAGCAAESRIPCRAPGTLPAWTSSPLQTEMSGGDPKSAQGQIRIGQLDAGGQRSDDGGQSAGGYDPGAASAGPFLHDPADHTVDRVSRSEEHAGLDAFLSAPADHPRWSPQLGGRQLGGASGQLVSRSPEAGHDCPSDEPGIGRDAIE